LQVGDPCEVAVVIGHKGESIFKGYSGNPEVIRAYQKPLTAQITGRN